MYLDRSRPELLRSCAGECDRGGTVHTWCLRGVGVEVIRGDDLDAGRAPVIGRHRVGMLVLVPVLMR